MKNKIILLLIFTVLCNSNLLSQVEETDSVRIYNNWANTQIKKNKYNEGFLYTQKAIKYANENSKIKDQAVQIAKLGQLFFILKKYDDAIEKLTESISLFKNLTPSAEYAKASYYLALSNIAKTNYDSAQIYINKTATISKALQIKDNDDLISLQKAILNRVNKKYDLAIPLLNSIIAKPFSDTFSDTQAEAYYQMGLIEKETNRYNLALSYFNKALVLNAKNVNLEQKSNILLAISQTYDKLLDKGNAYSYLKLHLNLKENIAISNNERLGINDYEAYKEQQKKELEKKKREQERTEKFSRLINYLSIALIAILSLLCFLLFKNNNIKKRTNQLLQEKNNELSIAKDKAEKASNARAEFLSTVSHELRTPLNAINGISHLLLEENPKKSQLHYLNSLQYSVNYLTAFINDILEINKIDSSKIELERISFDLKKLLVDIKKSFFDVATKNKNDLILEFDNNIPKNLIGDPIKLSQIFMNLINNALKFTKKGTVTIVAKLKSQENQKAIITFEIIDTGIGIPEDKFESIFESFSQGSIEINRKYGGTGLGLTIVKKTLELYDSKINLTSKLGEGSNFSFELALEIDTNKVEKTAEKEKIVDKSNLKGKNILVVEDNKINQMITKRMLENREVTCEVIDNGEEAIEVMKTKHYDLVLMDVHLPGINGTIATQEIRKFDTITPIVAITAISLNENREMLLSYGMNDVITKPFVPKDFYLTLSKYLS